MLLATTIMRAVRIPDLSKKYGTAEGGDIKMSSDLM